METTIIDRALGSGIPYVVYATPFFFLFIGIEWVVGWLERRRLYRMNDSINDLSCGIMQQIIGLFMRGGMFLGYVAIYERFHLLDVASFSPAGKWVAAGVLFLGVDLAYYWFHRIAHEMNAPWAAHVVHHQSEEYNLSVALRQGTFQGVFSWIFYVPLVVIGFPPLWLVAVMAFDTLYQFWIHTRAIDRLGPLEWLFNTPSHHRVHHARNPKYLDKNYAGTLIIWDRMFGTFTAEQEEPVYGLTKPLNSWNPLWANLHVWYELVRDAYLAPKWKDKLKIWFMPPGWRPDGLPPSPHGAEVSREIVISYDTVIPRGLTLYVFVQFVLTLVVSTAVLRMADRYSGILLVGLAAWIVWSLTNFGGVYERRRWAIASELLRLATSAIGCVAYIGGLVPSNAFAFDARWAFATTAMVGLSGVWLLAYVREFSGVATYYHGRPPGLIRAAGQDAEPTEAWSVAPAPGLVAKR